jgi:hypothetical protein
MRYIGGFFHVHAHGDGNLATANSPPQALWVMICTTGWRTPHHAALSDDGPKVVEVVAPEAIKIKTPAGMTDCFTAHNLRRFGTNTELA